MALRLVDTYWPPTPAIGNSMYGDQANKHSTSALKLHVCAQPASLNHTSWETTRNIQHNRYPNDSARWSPSTPWSCVSPDHQHNRYRGSFQSCYSPILALSTPVLILGPVPPRLEMQREKTPQHCTRVAFRLLVNWAGRESRRGRSGYLCVLYE